MAIAGCAHQPKPQPPPPPPPAQPAPLTPANTTPPQRQHYIIELLNAGQPEQARVEAEQLLKEQPTNTEATTFLNEINTDPQTLLGTQNFSYVVQPGETLTTLADRFLGDSNLFYALARYNNIDVPNSVTPGQSILVPSKRASSPEHVDHPVRPEHTERSEHREGEPSLRRREEPPARKPAGEPSSANPPPAAGPPAPARDTARANTLRSEALVAMNKGEIDRAVALLRQAAALYPDSQPIGADLARALRIQNGAHK